MEEDGVGGGRMEAEDVGTGGGGIEKDGGGGGGIESEGGPARRADDVAFGVVGESGSGSAIVGG